MKKAFVLAMGLLALSWGLGFGANVRYHGNPRLISDQGVMPGNAPGPGPFSFLGPPVFLDSSRNQFGIYVNRVRRISSNGSNIVGIVIRQYLTSSGILEAFTSTDTGTTWIADPNLNFSPPSMRYPTINFTPPEGYGFIIAASVISTFDAPWYIRNSGGYGSGLWDAPVQLRPSGESYQNAEGLWLGNSSKTICVPMEATTTGISLMSEVIDTAGHIVSDLQTIFDQNAGTQDCRDGKIACFGGGPSDSMNIKSSTDGGVTWAPDSMVISAGSPDSGWYEWDSVLLQGGSVGVLLTMDDIRHPYAGQHSAIQFFHKGRPKVTLFSPGPDQAAAYPTLARKADNTLVAVFEFVESGWDSVEWSRGRTFWDIGESHSRDGGLTWSPVRNLTNTDSVSECCPQIARFIGSNNRMHIVYGTSSLLSDTVDLYWASRSGSQVKTYNWYLRDSIPLGVEEQGTRNPGVVACGLGPVSPNPMRESGAISYQLPKPGPAALTVYDALGRRVRTLLGGVHPAGRFTASWDARDETGARVPAGIYFFRLQAGNEVKTAKVVMVR